MTMLVAEKFLFARFKRPMINQSCCVSCSKSLRGRKVSDGGDLLWAMKVMVMCCG